MVTFKRLGRITICLLLCIAAFAGQFQPASALTTSVPPVSNTVIPTTPPVTPEAPVAETAAHQVSNVRLYANYSSYIIGKMENGTKLTVLGSYGDFYKIDCYDMEGYIAKIQVRETESGEYYVNCDPNFFETCSIQSYNMRQALQIKSDVLQWSKKYLGVPYVWGGMSPWGFDCSGLVKYVYARAGMDVGRTTTALLQQGMIIAKEDMQMGDLVFFSNTVGVGFCSHVGIYVGNGQVLHSSTRGVVISDLNTPYYIYHYLASRRMVVSDLNPIVSIPTEGALAGDNASYWRN